MKKSGDVLMIVFSAFGADFPDCHGEEARSEKN